MAQSITVNIATGGSLSAAGKIGGEALVGIIMPSAWTTANLTFQVSQDGLTYNNLYDDSGSEVVVTAAASEHITLPIARWLSMNYVKVRSGTAATPVTQTRSGGTDIQLLTYRM